MADDIHFLERTVERLAGPSLDIAMALYRDAELVRFIAERVLRPGDERRLAIALNPDSAGPFVVFEPNGHFVTCLGPDMKLQAAKLLPLESVGSLLAQHEVWQERWRLANERGSGKDAWRGLMQRLYERGDLVSREDFGAVAAFFPLLVDAINHAHNDLNARFLTQSNQCLRFLKKPPKHLSQQAELEDWWHDYMWLGTLPVLMGLDPSHAFIDESRSDLVGLTVNAYQTSDSTIMLRNYWMVARFGKRLLPSYRKQLRTAQHPYVFADALMGLVAIGSAHPSLRTEVRKLLRGPSGPSPAWTTPFAEDLAAGRGTFDQTLDAQDECIAFTVERGRTEIHAMLDAREHELLEQWPKPEDIPEDIAMGMVFQTSISLLEQPEQLNSFLVLLTAIVSLEPEQMFWPEALCDIFYNKWEVDDGLALLKHWGGIHQGPQPVRNEPKIGRNAPCPCGSGKKYKRCCIDS